MASKWIDFQKELWRGTNKVDWIIEDAGDGPRFYCVHDCESLTEHYNRAELDREMRKLWQRTQSSR